MRLDRRGGADRFHALAARVTATHSYDLPAITVVTLTATDEYLAWVDEQCRHDD